MIYLDYAATTPLDEEVLKKMFPYLTKIYGNSSSQHGVGRQASNALFSARDRVANILGCRSDEVYFTSGGTEADNWAIKGVCQANQGNGKHIVLSAIEHPALIESAKDLCNQGFTLTLVKPDKSGIVDPESIKNAIREDTVFCGVMHANNETGVIQRIPEIGAICKERGVFFFCDCVQTAGVLPLPIEHVDALSISAHKFYGPKGVGALIVKKGKMFSRLISGGHQERKMRGGTVNVAGVVGLAEALNNAVANMQENNEKIKKIRDAFTAKVLKEISGVSINGDIINRLPNNINLSFDGCEGEQIVMNLDRRGVCASTGAACSSGAVTVSPVLLSMGLSEPRARGAVRFTFGKNTSVAEIGGAAVYLKSSVMAVRMINKK
ncbi:MAG: cysteine desulfurase [Clostridiales bacterium]|nr:cysteine desulfurase [Clostridiales bacterium]